MTIVTENLRAKDLQHLVKKVYEIDAYKSKIGDDEKVIVISFTVEREDPAKDLETFIEMGYDCVLDADVSPGETDDGIYKVFVEIERSRHAPEQILDILYGIEKLTGMDDMRFRYFKSFKSYDTTLENLASIIPTNSKSYIEATARHRNDNYLGFFSKSSVNDINVVNETITFTKQYASPLSFKIINSAPKEELYNSIPGPLMMESADIAEVLFFTKYIGDFNITKIGNTFIFENNGWGVALEKLS